MTARIVLLVCSPRLPAGIMTAEAWDVVRTLPVFAAAEGAQVEALRRAGVTVTVTGGGATALLAAASASSENAESRGAVCWLAGPDGDESIARELGLRLAREPGLAELELMYGSWDPPGARLLDAVAVIDRLASPGGDPWKRQQTHQSLAKYMIEEAYEVVDAIAAEDYDGLREELGDVLLQVLLHARMAEDRAPGQAWSVDDVAASFVAKMIRRNPHVFADAEVSSVDEITQQWERIKASEKAGKSAMDSIALSQPALSLAAKIQSRATQAGHPLTPGAAEPGAAEPGTAVAARLWALVAEASAAGLDVEAELRRYALSRIAELRASESHRRSR